MNKEKAFTKAKEEKIQKYQKMEDAAQRILETVTELHLTLHEFEEILKDLKYRIYISGCPGTEERSSSRDE